MENKSLSIIIFPYLFAEKAIEVEGILFKPSFRKIIETENSTVQNHLHNIEKLIANGITEDIGIDKYLFATLENVTETSTPKILKSLDKLATTLRYIGLTSSSAKYEHFNYAIFFILNPHKNIESDYYQAFINGSNIIDIYKETPYSMFEVSTPVHILLEETRSKLYQHVYVNETLYYRKGELQEILNSIKWFNKSFRENTSIDNPERLVNLVTALESLFGSPQSGQISSTVAQCIFTLLGKTEELQTWIKQVFDKRSQTIHKGTLPDVVYRDKETKKPHISDILYAQKIYKACLEEILQLREKQIFIRSLKEELVSNERRLKDIKKSIYTKDITLEKLYEAHILDTIVSLSRRDTTGDKKLVKEIGIKLLDLTEHLYVDDKDTLTVKENIAKEKGDAIAVLYGKFHQGIKKIYLNKDNISAKELPEFASLSALYSFSKYATWKLH